MPLARRSAPARRHCLARLAPIRIASPPACLFWSQERVPDAKNMFSEIRRFPRAGYRLPHKEELPKHMTRQVMDPSAVPGQPSAVAAREAREAVDVSGTHRHRFFAQPTGGATLGGVPL